MHRNNKLLNLSINYKFIYLEFSERFKQKILFVTKPQIIQTDRVPQD